MGLFDRLLGNAAKRAINDAIDSVTGNHSSSATSAPASQPQYTPAPQAPVVEELSLEQKLDKILPSEFPAYQVAKEVPPATMGGVGKSLIPFSYVISQNGQVKLIIMRCYGNTCGSRGYRFSKQFAESSGWTLINFLENSPNEESYIINRLHRFL
ncbi:MAG: hypothetical protein J5750_01155 [Clostridiales bacterium]|nr:hypothetical protein [Clostridiales bacterium]